MNAKNTQEPPSSTNHNIITSNDPSPESALNPIQLLRMLCALGHSLPNLRHLRRLDNSTIPLVVTA